MLLLKQLIKETLPTSPFLQHFLQLPSNNPIKLYKHNNHVFSSSFLDQSFLFNLPITPQAKAFHSFSPQRESPPPQQPSLALSLFYTAFNHIRSTTSKPTFITVSSLHCLALKTWVSVDVHILTSLLNLYSKAGDFDSSWKLFEEIPERDVISWNAMITACFRDHRFEFLLGLFKEMVKEGSGFDSTTLLIVLSALSRMNDFRQGQSLHGLGLKKGMMDFDSESFLCNCLIDMYAKCGEWRSSELVFEDMGSSNRDPTTWNSMMSGFLHNGLVEKVLGYFKRMVVSGVPADNVSLSCTISACSCLGELHLGQAIHGFGIKLGYGENTTPTAVLNSLISFYSQCGEVEAAEKLFSGIVIYKDVVSWNSMIHGFAVSGMTFKAFDLLSEMQLEWDIQPDSATLISVLPLCAEFKLLREGRAVHGFIVRKEMCSDLLVKNSLLDMYAKCKSIKPMELLFKTSLQRDLVSWNTMIAVYPLSEHSRKAQTLFQEMLHLGYRCSLSTLLAILPSCNSPKELHLGKLIHGLQLKMGFCSNLFAVNALMFMYINCGDVLVSFSLLQSIADIADVVSWNTVIVGCTQNDHFLEALEAFEKLRWQPNITPDSITLVNVLSACGNLEGVSKGRLLHGITIKTQVGLDIRVSNALITMYSRCKDIESARSVFISSGQCRNLCSWNCMISAFAQNKDGKGALELFHHLEFEPNEFTIVSILSASNQLGDLTYGKQIHGYICRFGFQQNPFILAALVDMYSKCGRLNTAVQIFEDSPEKMKSVAAWNSMISAYGYHGHGTKAIELFHKMCESGENGATKSTFVSLLSACNHSGMIEEGYSYYEHMLEEFGVKPDIEHHVCMVDMLGRAGRIREAYEFIKGLPDHQRPSATGGGGVWGALLSACQYHGDLSMGEEVAEHLFSLEPENVGYYVSLCNIYTAAGRWSDAMDIRRKILDRRLRKPPGCSFIS